MHDDEDRYTRQRRLREIGDAGQERLLAARVTLGGRPAGGPRRSDPSKDRSSVIELVYLERAGVGSVTIDSLAAPRAFAHADAFHHDPARRHAAAAWRALRTIVEVAVLDSPGARSP
jgi:hypothetical protein